MRLSIFLFTAIIYGQVIYYKLHLILDCERVIQGDSVGNSIHFDYIYPFTECLNSALCFMVKKEFAKKCCVVHLVY